jgi:molecular chaperone GrpE (heat shock protein)
VDEQLSAIRSTESVNQRLFDSLHDELLKYRDNFLHESLQKPFIHDLVHLFDDLTALSAQLRNASEEKGKRTHVAQWRDNLENAVHSLTEILHRFEVNEIEPRENVDRSLHRVLSYEPADFPEEDGRIVMRVKRGFLWREKLIRPEEVIAKRFG